MSFLPPLPADFEPHFQLALAKINEIADKFRHKRPGSNRRIPSISDQSSSREITELLIPGLKAGLVIGQNGETLKRLEKVSNASIRFDPHFTKEIENVVYRKIIIMGHPNDIAEAKELISERIDNKTIDPKYPTIYVSIPLNRVGLVIGKGGETIRELQELSGAKVQLVQESVVDQSSSERFISITGDQGNIEKAKQMINDLVYQTGRAGAFIPSMGGKGQSLVIQVPEASVGAIIGRRAENLKQLQSLTATRIFVDTSPNTKGPTRSVTISGPTEESLIYARQLVEEKVANHMAVVEGTLGLDPNQPGFVYQAPSELMGKTTSNLDVDPSAISQYYMQYYSAYQDYIKNHTANQS